MSTQRYLVTARKYRPQVFNELVAQEHVTETLKNAIRMDRLAHAYLFSGPRGVGKTTAARVLAKAINCTTPPEERIDQAEPCRTCDSCRSFEEARSLNIIEIDAASNNKVEDVRELRDTVRVPPQGARKKVYIVDEVHMLTTQAFNALLKTLEEPPPYALFIFATTEPNKVIPTILSRCQRFDFRRIPVADIVAHLREICAAEGVEADDASLLLLARKGDGALRDALSAFDQAVSLCGTTLRYAELAAALRVVEIDLYFRLADFIVEGDSAGALRLVDEIVRGGFDLQEFLGGVAEHLRNVLVAATVGDTDLIEATEESRERFVALSRRLSEADVLRMLTIVDDADRTLRNSAQPRLKVELALLKMTALPRATDLREVIRKIEQLEQRSGGPPGAEREPESRTAPAANVSTKSAPPPAAPAGTGTPAPRRQDVHPPEAQTSPRPSNVHALRPEPAAPRDRQGSPEPAPGSTPDRPHPDEPPPEWRPDSTPSDASRAVETPGLFGPPALRRRELAAGRRQDDETVGRAMFAGSGALAASPDPEATPATAPAPGVAVEAWLAGVEDVQRDRIHVGTLLRHCRPADYRSGTLTIAVPDAFHRRMLGSEDAYLVRRLNDILPVQVQIIRLIVQEDLQRDLTSETATEIDPLEYFNRKREENPVVRAIFDQFGGELVW